MSLHPNEVLLAPVVSEKSYALIERGNTYSFRIHPDAHKTQVRQAVEELFEVKVLRVNISKVQPKPKRRGLHKGMTPGGVIDKPAPLAVSKVMVVCPSCNLPTRVGHVFREVKGKKVKIRVCRRDGCGGELDK